MREVSLSQMEMLWRAAAHLANSSFAPKDFRGKRDEVYAALLTGMELGLGPMAALRHISVIDGKPSLSAAMQLALLRRAGHTIVVEEQSATRCAIVGSRNGEELRVEYTVEEAKAAGLGGKQNWQRYPADMLWARCVSRYARRADAGATLGLYSPADWDERDTAALAADDVVDLIGGGGDAREASRLLASVETPPATEALVAPSAAAQAGGDLAPSAREREAAEALLADQSRMRATCPECGERVPVAEYPRHRRGHQLVEPEAAP